MSLFTIETIQKYRETARNALKAAIKNFVTQLSLSNSE